MSRTNRCAVGEVIPGLRNRGVALGTKVPPVVHVRYGLGVFELGRYVGEAEGVVVPPTLRRSELGSDSVYVVCYDILFTSYDLLELLG